MSNPDYTSASNPTIKDFVLQQAYERAFEISVLGLKQYEKQRAKIITERKQMQKNQFEKKHKEAEASARIQRSTLINGSRMKKMRARHADLLKVISEAEIKLKVNVINNQQIYAGLLKSLILEGLVKMFEPVVYVRCLNRDRALVESVLGQVRSQFRKLVVQNEIDESLANVDLRIDDRFFLIERTVGGASEDKISKAQQSTKCFGGVILTSEDGLIVCKNTIDSRVELAYQTLLPTIRTSLFC